MPYQRRPSPYRPGTGLEPPYLGDREGQLERFRSFLEDPSNPRNLVVTGLRGVGKTVLLNHYSQEAEGESWVVAEREFSEPDAEPHAFARTILDDLARLTRRLSRSARLGNAAAALTEGLLAFLGTLSVSYGEIKVGLSVRNYQSEASGRLDDDLREALTRVGELCRRTEHRGFVLRYDEFQVIRERKDGLTLSGLLAAVSGAQQRGVPVMLVLCGLSPLLENLSRSKSYSERMFTIEELTNLRPPEDRAALVDPAVRAGRRYEEEAVDQVLLDTAGYPFFIQVYGDSLWRGARGEQITAADVHRLRPAILAGLDRGFFEARYLRASRNERVLLRQVADHGESATMEELVRASGLRNNQLQPLVSSLIRKGLLYRPARGRISFTAPLFGSFVRRREAD
ncbi:MAG: ATP-binding protein [Candidatus Dormibacteraeota bacterium]|nr:ATP-binding protein [Candidatus Dormibacteraeota bacterium]